MKRSNGARDSYVEKRMKNSCKILYGVIISSFVYLANTRFNELILIII